MNITYEYVCTYEGSTRFELEPLDTVIVTWCSPRGGGGEGALLKYISEREPCTYLTGAVSALRHFNQP
jgi:hypothetical protein